MPIEEIPLTGGVEQHADSRKLSGGLLSSVNAAQTKMGRYAKRLGTSALSTVTTGLPGTVTAPFVMAPRGNEKVAIETGRLHSYSPGFGASNYIDQVSEFTVRERSVVQLNGSNGNPDMAVSGDGKYLCVAWVGNYDVVSGTNNTIYVAVQDATSNALLLGPVSLGTGTFWDRPRVLYVNSRYFVVVWADISGGKLRGAYLDTQAPLPWSLTSSILCSDVASTGAFDACINGTGVVVAYCNNSGTVNKLSLRNFSATLVAGTTNLGVATTTATLMTAISVDVGAFNAWVGYYTGSPDFTYSIGNFNTTTLAMTHGPLFNTTGDTAAAFQVSIKEFDSSHAIFQWSEHTAGTNVTTSDVISTGGTAFGKRSDFGKVMQSRPVKAANGKMYQLMSTQTYSLQIGDVMQGTTLLMEVTYADDNLTPNLMMRPVCTWAPRLCPEGSGFTTIGAGQFWHVCGLWVDTNNNLRSVSVQTSFNTFGEDNNGYPHFSIYDLTFTQENGARQCAELGGLLYLSGGVPSWYDGMRVGEISFLQYPHATAAQSTAGGGGLTTTSTYQYAIVFAQRDAAGNVHRSAPYIVPVVLTGTNNTITLTLQYAQNTTRQDAYLNLQTPTIEVYRTTSNGAIFYQLTGSNDAATGVTASSTGTMRNDPTTATFAYQDKAGDGVLAGQPILYTQGNELENVCPPSARLLCVHRGRIFLAGTPDGKTVWASKKQVYGEAPGFSEGLTIYIDEGGDVTALASMDDKLVIFKSDRIFVVSGDGPDNTGANNDWSEPVKLNGTVGAIAANVAVTPLGIVFRSNVGLSLVTRGLEVQAYWGSSVEDEVATYPLITGAVTHPTLPEIRICMAKGDYSAGEELRYDYRHNAWFPAQYGYNGSARACLRSAAVLQGVVHYSTNGGSIFYEDPTTYLDGGTYAPTSLEFAPIATAGTQGYQGFRSAIFEFDRYTDHDLTVQFAYDDRAYTDSKTIAAATSAAWASYQFEISPPSSNKCSRFKVKVSDTFTTGTLGLGKGWSASAISFDVFPKEGANRKLPAAQRV